MAFSAKRSEHRIWIYLGMLNLKPTDSVLDFGCGEGSMITRFKHYCAHITGIDKSKAALKIASQVNPDCNFINDDITTVNLPKKSYDVVYCFEVLQYIPQKQLVFKKMFQLARRSIVFSAPNFDSLWAHITKARQAVLGIRAYPDSPTKQWIKKDQFNDCVNIRYEFHSLASRVQEGFQGSLKYYLRRLLRYNLFLVARIDLKNDEE